MARLGSMTIRTALLQEVDAFLQASGMSPTRFSKEATGSNSWYTRLQQGYGTTIDTADTARAYMARWWKAKERRPEQSRREVAR